MLGTLFQFGADTTKYSKAVASMPKDMAKASKEIESSVGGMNNAFSSLAKRMAVIGAAFAGVYATVKTFNDAIAYGGQLNDLSARTGETAGNLAILQRAFENAGAGADSVGTVINKLQKAVVEAGQGGKEQAEAFAMLGLNIEDLKRKTPTEQLKAVAGALSAVGNDSDRSALAMKLLGRSGGELIPLLRAMGSELENAKEQLGSTPKLIDQTSQYLDAIGDNIGAISAKGREFMVGVLSKIAPGLAAITDQIAKIDAAGLGAIFSGYIERMGRALSEALNFEEGLERIRLAIEQISNGDMSGGLELLFKSARNLGMSTINELLAAAMAGIQTIWQTLSELFRSDGPLTTMLGHLIGYVGAKLSQAVNEAMASLPRILGGGQGRADTAAAYGKTADNYLKNAGIAATMLGMDLENQGGQLMSRFQSNYASAGRPFDMGGREAEVQALTDKAVAPTVDKAKRLMQDLQVLMAREPDSEQRRAKEAQLIEQIKALRSNTMTAGAINRMTSDAASAAIPASASSDQKKTDTGKPTASEGTLQKVVELLASLDTKLPQTVLA